MCMFELCVSFVTWTDRWYRVLGIDEQGIIGMTVGTVETITEVYSVTCALMCVRVCRLTARDDDI